MRKLLRTRAADGDRDLIVVTDEGHETDIQSLDEAYMVISVLANKLRAFYAAAADRPCSHALDGMGAHPDTVPEAMAKLT